MTAMPSITLPDGSSRQFDHPVSVFDVAQSIAPSLAKAALLGKVNGQLVDTHTVISEDAELAIITDRDQEGVEVIRHSCAHLMAQAVKQLYPSAQVTIGPVIENGFFYDFAYERAFTPEDLEAIEARMGQLAKQNIPITRRELPRDEAVSYFKGLGEDYKAEIIDSIPSEEALSLYRQDDFEDLCRGPHVPSTGRIKAFKLMKVAGAYWRGDSNNAMLQRIYGTAWSQTKDLKAYLHRLEEAAKRDHRKLGREMDLFHMQEEAPGQIFWHANGWRIYTQLQDYMRRRQEDAGYIEVNTPQVVDRKLWEASGHWEKYQENMFIVEVDEEHAREKAVNALKPMNCPCHVQIFNQGIKSYRDLPLRMAEFGSCNRYEPSGALHGIMRVRGFTQDDAHIFCREDQIAAETRDFIEFLRSVYADLGFTEFSIKFSDRPAERAGSDAVWDQAEAALMEATTAAGYTYTLNPGEGAFYGPKLEFVLTDAIGRDWQCGTLQVDFVLPERLDANYIGEDSQKHRPVMLHRATLGSFERFIGIMIEHYAGKLPGWLAPVQVAVLNITDAHAEYAREVHAALRAAGVRAELDLRNEKVGYKIREHTLSKIPHMIVLGAKELDERSISVRDLDGTTHAAMPLAQAVQTLAERLRFRSAG